jgi:hypothetical protein
MAKKKEPKPPKAGKSGKGGSGGSAKKSKIPRPVQGRGFALFGLLALAPIAWMLLKGQLDLEAAAQRAVIVLVGLMLLERLIAPLIMAVVNSGPRESAPEPDEEPAPDAV